MTPTSLNTAFTRTDAVVVSGVIGLLVAIVLPALANDRTRSSRVICANNLRQIGSAMQTWGNDHGDRRPQEVPVEEGGTRRHVLAVNTWVHYSKLSNDLTSPKVLHCPADTGQPADEFSNHPAKGYFNPNFANRATSYALAYDLFSANRIMAADRNLQFNVGPAGCSVFNTAWGIGLRYFGSGWTNGLHQFAGNFLSFDGAVEQANNSRLIDVFNSASRDDGASSIHFSVPR